MPPSGKQSPSGPEVLRQILQDRARTLARQAETAAAAEGCLEVLEFTLANERYALETVYVREVYPLKEFTPLPCTPPFILGIINVRGQILAVSDLKRFFNLPDKGISDLNKVIILRRGSLEMAILADAIIRVRTISLPEVQAPPPTLEGVSPGYIKGLTREALIVLDVEKILADPKLIVHEEVEPPTNLE